MTQAPEVTEERRWLEYMDVDQIVPALRNPKRHELDELRASFNRFGFTIPILHDERTGRITAGHGRCQLLQIDRAAGRPVPEGVREVEGRWFVPVTRGWSSENDPEAEAYLIADNRLPQMAGWDDEKLLGGLRELQAGPGLAGVGFVVDDIDDIYARIQERAARQSPAPQALARHSQIRSLVLDFPLDEYAEVARIAHRARAAYSVTSNPELFIAMCREKLESW